MSGCAALPVSENAPPASVTVPVTNALSLALSSTTLANSAGIPASSTTLPVNVAADTVTTAISAISSVKMFLFIVLSVFIEYSYHWRQNCPAVHPIDVH